MYYLEDLTQEAIASRLGLSRPKVGRLLGRARDLGIVQITVQLPAGLAMPLETDLVERFGLSAAIVIADQPDEDGVRERTGREVISLLDRVLGMDCTLAIGMGRNVRAVSQQPAVLRPRNCTVVTAIGGSALVGGGLNSTDVVSRLADALGGTPKGLHAPAYAPTKEVRDAFLGHDDVARTLEHARAADVAVVGIGDADVESLVVRLGCITADDMVRMRTDGAVGDILGSFFNVDGQPIAEWIEERVVGLTRDDLRRIPNVIAVAFEATKGPAILGALRSGLVDTLVTSASMARQVLDLAGSGRE